MKSIFLLLLAVVFVEAQYSYSGHYGYQNPYQYHPYMRYHSYHQGAQKTSPKPAEKREEKAELHRPTSTYNHYAYQPRHYAAYQQQQSRSYGQQHYSTQPASYRGYHYARPHENSVTSGEHDSMMMMKGEKMAMKHKPQEPEAPKYLGTFKNPTHDVKGDIFMLDENRLYIQGFSFDGSAPDVFFWADGVPIPYYTRSNGQIVKKVEASNNEDVVLLLPPEKPTLQKMRKFTIWCKEYGVTFGEFSIDS